LHVCLVHGLSILLRLAAGDSLQGQLDYVRTMVLHRQVLDSGFSLPLVYLGAIPFRDAFVETARYG